MGLAISMTYAKGDPAPPNSDTTPHIENITYDNITGTSGTAGAFICLPESECRNLHMNNINITSFIGDFECFRVQGTSTGENSPNPCF